MVEQCVGLPHHLTVSVDSRRTPLEGESWGFVPPATVRSRSGTNVRPRVDNGTGQRAQIVPADYPTLAVRPTSGPGQEREQVLPREHADRAAVLLHQQGVGVLQRGNGLPDGHRGADGRERTSSCGPRRGRRASPCRRRAHRAAPARTPSRRPRPPSPAVRRGPRASGRRRTPGGCGPPRRWSRWGACAPGRGCRRAWPAAPPRSTARRRPRQGSRTGPASRH